MGREEPGRGSHSCPVLPAADAPWLVHRSRTGRGLARLQLLEAYLRALLAAGNFQRECFAFQKAQLEF